YSCFSAIRSTHIARMRPIAWTRHGSVVIGGDASNDVLAPHEFTRRPIRWRGWRRELTSAPVFYRQSMTSDLGAMGKRVGAKFLVLTHLGPSPGVATQPVARSGRSIDASGLTQSRRAGRVRRKYDCENRTCDPAASGEVNKVIHPYMRLLLSGGFRW